VVVADFPMPPGTRFDWHTHVDHQLAWAASGVLTVLTQDATWVLPPTRALWIPAGLPHETGAEGRATMRTLYIRPDLSPVTWAGPTPVAASRLLAELIGYLGGTLQAAHRAHAETLLADLLTPMPRATIQVRLPSTGPARQVARALRASPHDRRTLPEWGGEVGASGRTLERAFVAEAGVPFGRWRTLVRLQAALPMLAAGQPVSRVAGRVGYETPSAFVAAFRRETGQTPASYFRNDAAYPAVLFIVFGNDTRVDPVHAYKMCAALQYATSSGPGQPVLLRAEDQVGHGPRAVSRMAGLAGDTLAFAARYTGLELG
jgi:AraC-like DNA-binding protein